MSNPGLKAGGDQRPCQQTRVPPNAAGMAHLFAALLECNTGLSSSAEHDGGFQPSRSSAGSLLSDDEGDGAAAAGSEPRSEDSLPTSEDSLPIPSSANPKKRKQPEQCGASTRRRNAQELAKFMLVPPSSPVSDCTCLMVTQRDGKCDVPVPVWPVYRMEWSGEPVPEHTWIIVGAKEQWVMRLIDTITSKAVRDLASKFYERIRRGLRRLRMGWADRGGRRTVLCGRESSWNSMGGGSGGGVGG